VVAFVCMLLTYCRNEQGDEQLFLLSIGFQ